uniref:Coiled-coil domain-containing protein 51 n=1 Tax=Syphacia muris TaxID=451379 RepID=A0A0N5AS41_9BILA
MNIRLSMNRFSTWHRLSSPNVGLYFLPKERLKEVVQRWEDFFGLTAVRIAQEQVIQCEKRLNEAQKNRRQKQAELKKLQNHLKDLHSELDRTSRGDDRFLQLLTEEHAAIKKERILLEEFEEAETFERDTFQALSSCVRSSHEKERERVEKNKYLSLWATVTGAVFGVIGTTLASELRMRRLKDMIPTAAQVTPVLQQVRELVEKQHAQVVTFINDLRDIMDAKDQPEHVSDLKLRLNGSEDCSVEKLTSSIEEQSKILTREMDEVKKLIALDRCKDLDPKDVVYVGTGMKSLLGETEKKLESKMKLQTLLNVVCMYAVAVITVPIIITLVRGN